MKFGIEFMYLDTFCPLPTSKHDVLVSNKAALRLLYIIYHLCHFQGEFSRNGELSDYLTNMPCHACVEIASFQKFDYQQCNQPLLTDLFKEPFEWLLVTSKPCFSKKPAKIQNGTSFILMTNHVSPVSSPKSLDLSRNRDTFWAYCPLNFRFN